MGCCASSEGENDTITRAAARNIAPQQPQSITANTAHRHHPASSVQNVNMEQIGTF